MRWGRRDRGTGECGDHSGLRYTEPSSTQEQGHRARQKPVAESQGAGSRFLSTRRFILDSWKALGRKKSIKSENIKVASKDKKNCAMVHNYPNLSAAF